MEISPSEGLENYKYEIAQARDHPAVDMYKTLKHSLFPQKWIKPVGQIQRKGARMATFLYAASYIACCPALICRAEVGQPLSVVALLFQVPLILSSFMSLRTDMIRVLMGTYDFWFFFVVNTGSLIVMSIYVRDVRVTLAISTWIGMLYNILVDASIRGLLLLRISLVSGIAYAVVLQLVVGLRLMPKTQTFYVFQYGTRAVTAEELLVSNHVTLIFMLVRSLYRKQKLQSRHSHSTRVFRCASYRCSVMLQHCTNQNIFGNENVQATRSAATSSKRDNPNQMEFVQPNSTFDYRHTLAGLPLTAQPMPRWRTWLYQICYALAVSLTLGSFAYMGLFVGDDPIQQRLALASTLFTAVFCGISLLMSHPGLLRQICFSFDFLFLSLQIVIAHGCVCESYSWDSRVWAMVSSFIWLHWVLLLDALTPIARKKLGVRHYHAALVMMGSILLHFLLLHQMTDHTRWRMRDRHVAIPLHGFTYDLYTMPLLFNRTWMLLLWECRVLWRVVKAGKNDLIIIHGTVVFNISTATSVQVMPESAVKGVTPATSGSCRSEVLMSHDS